MAKLKKGDKIPSFTLTNQHGYLFNIDTIIGKKNLVIYFYPRNETKVCTAQACSFRDAYQDFQDFDCEVIGISADNVKSHISFAENHSLPFILLSDGDKKIRKLFGVSNDLLIIPGRTTYVVNKEGIIIHVFNDQLSAGKHIKESLLALAQ
ncbi:MAG: peroxiredoxin [Flavobacteriales bacterium]|nr:peroxiredoxin [Flavobacteriales bacterium]